jgi:hypothetical protein
MALQKHITNIRTGHANEYWRVDVIAIDRPKALLEIVLAGYASQQAPAQHQPDDGRSWRLHGAAFAALGGRTLLTDLRSAGYPVDSWPQEVQAALAAETTYNVNARGCYETIREQRRPLPDGSVLQENGDALLPTGELIPAADIEGMPDAPTIPSEFADALDV